MKDSPVYLESIARVLLLILAPVHRFRARRMAVMGSCPYFVCMEGLYGALYLAVARWTFRFIRLQRLLLIDDPRNVALLTKAARSLGIRTVGYMHGKFNRFHVGLLVEPFDVYLVWNEYFAEKIKMLWGGSYPGLVQNVGLTRMGASHWLEKVQKPLHRVLWLDEDETSFEQSRPYLVMLLQDPKVTVIVRLKPGKRRTNDYAELGCIVDDSPGFYASVVLNRIAAVVGCHSTALLEARLFGAVPIGVATDLDYGHELVDDGLVLGCTSPEELMRIVYGIISTDGGHGPMAAKFLAPEGDLNVFNAVAASAVLALEGFEMCNG